MSFDQFIRYRALAFKFVGQNLPESIVEQAIASSDVKMKQVCAPLTQELFDDLESMCQMLDISKRKFIEEAIADALKKASKIVEEEDVFEHHIEGAQQVQK